MFRQKDVPGIATIHHPLRDVNRSTGNVCPIIHVRNLTDRPAVDTHAYLDMRMICEGSANLERASRGLFRTAEKKERHPIRPKPGNGLLKTRIAAQRVPKREQLQSATAKGASVADGGAALFACEIFIASPRSDHREILMHERAIDCVFFDR